MRAGGRQLSSWCTKTWLLLSATFYAGWRSSRPPLRSCCSTTRGSQSAWRESPVVPLLTRTWFPYPRYSTRSRSTRGHFSSSLNFFFFLFICKIFTKQRGKGILQHTTSRRAFVHLNLSSKMLTYATHYGLATYIMYQRLLIFEFWTCNAVFSGIHLDREGCFCETHGSVRTIAWFQFSFIFFCFIWIAIFSIIHFLPSDHPISDLRFEVPINVSSFRISNWASSIGSVRRIFLYLWCSFNVDEIRTLVAFEWA